VARNAIVDRRRALGPVPAEPVDEPSSDAGPDERAESSWTAWRVHRALAELPEQERKLIELAYWGGLSQSEIADFVGIPLGTVKTRTRSALSRLADALEGELSLASHLNFETWSGTTCRPMSGRAWSASTTC